VKKELRWVVANPEDAADMVRMVELGASVYAIACSFGCCMEWAWARVRALGLTKSLKRRPTFEIELERSQERVGSIQDPPEQLAIALLEILCVWGHLVLSLRAGELLASVPGSAAAKREERAGRILGLYSEGIRFRTLAEELQFVAGQEQDGQARSSA
jgi:hypothetical protein